MSWVTNMVVSFILGAGTMGQELWGRSTGVFSKQTVFWGPTGGAVLASRLMARYFSPHPRKSQKAPSNFWGLVRSFLFLSQSEPEQLLVSVARTEIKKFHHIPKSSTAFGLASVFLINAVLC